MSAVNVGALVVVVRVERVSIAYVGCQPAYLLEGYKVNKVSIAYVGCQRGCITPLILREVGFNCLCRLSTILIDLQKNSSSMFQLPMSAVNLFADVKSDLIERMFQLPMSAVNL